MSMQDFNNDLIEQFRANAGEIKEGMFKGFPILLLTTKGAKSGASYTTPLAYTRDGDNYVIIASKGGAPTHPGWFHNLIANPTVTIEVGPEKFDARAAVTEGQHRRRLYDAQAAIIPSFKEYEKKTTREIPVVALERI